MILIKQGEFHDKNTVFVGDKLFSSKYILITVGATSRPITLPGAEYLTTSDQFLDLEELPER
ncbi:MAG: hypothetical protein R2741_06965 [Methanolobus sp.]